MGRGIFITGTDTGVGKTIIAAALAALLMDNGVNVGVMKPAESGCRRENGKLFPEDAVLLREMAQSQDEMELINPYAFEHPLTPALAAEMEGVEIRVNHIREAFRELSSRHEVVLVEGAGGLLSPITSDLVMADLVDVLGGLPLLIVVRTALGTLNHTLLSLHYARSEGIAVLGIVANEGSPSRGLADSLASASLRRWASAPLLGRFPYLAKMDRENLKEAARAALNIDPVLKWIRRRSPE